MIKFLFIIPTLNSYKLLPKLVNSLENQSYKNWRVLFVDGNSNEEHRKYLDELCESNLNFYLIEQSPFHKGIFGAMNQGIKFAYENEYVLFWGSDDWAPGKKLLFELNNKIKKDCNELTNIDLLVCAGRYFDFKKSSLSRKTCFKKGNINFFNKRSFRNKLFFGNTPPHQATIFTPKFFKRKIFFDEELEITADLDIFLKISKFNDLSIYANNLEIVYMGNEGISNKKTIKKLKEVFSSYRKTFYEIAFVPFIFRYSKKVLTKFNVN
ncbi:MAG: glycosyltransferase [Prochlorococcus marinus CUG1437]|nr:glycosyltransferase [Prochlorococcus marinus CUG1437]